MEAEVFAHSTASCPMNQSAENLFLKALYLHSFVWAQNETPLMKAGLNLTNASMLFIIAVFWRSLSKCVAEVRSKHSVKRWISQTQI